ncbi:unnamed protein product [Adineta steineri]|uniref:Uncharacterized protein n=1 Tax=Adineta steineri TaxID=433720 RepID=A0A819S565_9BILA|nr:unnamed protein product [Adineta steineri]
MSRFYPLDFRLMAMSQFQVLASLCRTAAWTISSDLNQFLAQQIVTNQAVSREVFEAQVEAVIEQMQTTTIANVQYIDQLISLITLNSGIMSALNTNRYVVQNPLVSSYTIEHGRYPIGNYIISNTSNSNNTYCDCADLSNCTFQAGYYTYSIRPAQGQSIVYKPSPLPMFIVPGMLAGCLPHDSMLQSTLECFYNRSCLDLIGISQTITSLNATVPSRFQVNTTVNTIFKQLFVETWGNSSNFTSYYNTCDPKVCSYTYTHRGNFLYAMTMLLSLIGGLTTILGIVVPLLIQVFRRLLVKCRGEAIPTIDNNPEAPSIGGRLLNLIHRIRQLISTSNMFETSFTTVNLGIQTTRLYIFLTFMGAVILFSYSLLSVTTISVTIQQPSLDTFEKLYSQYSSTLVCPCTGLSVSYSEIMTVTPHFHQLCSSDFIRDDRWLLYFQTTSVNTTNVSTAVTLFTADFRANSGSSLFTLMQTLCETAKTTFVNAAAVFGATKLVNAYPMSYILFEKKTTELAQQFQQETQASFLTLFSQISTAIRDNQFYSPVGIAPNVKASPDRTQVQLRLRIMYPSGSNCSCAISSNCTRPLGFYCSASSCHNINVSPNFTAPGMYMGCTPIDSLLVSTLDCLFNQSCIQFLLDWRLFDISSKKLPIDPRGANTTALDLDLPSRFLPNSTFEPLVCSSDFVAQQWWSYLWGIDNVTNFGDLQLLSIQFRILASLCSLAQQSIDNDTSEFLSNKLVTLEAVSFSLFQAQIDSLTAAFIVQTPDKFRRTQSYIYERFRANQLLTIPETNWQIAFTTAAYNYVIATVPRTSFGNNYSCITSLNSFSRSLYIDANSNTTLLPGVVAGCLPIDGIRLSTLECFFDSNCILNLTSVASTRTTTIWIAKPLNASTPTIYPSNTLIGSLVDSLFVEDWGIKSNYSSYFASCAPYSCSYKYIDHNTILYIITTLLGLYGGLTVVLSFTIWYGWRMYQKIMRWMQIAPRLTSARVVPFQPTIHIE